MLQDHHDVPEPSWATMFRCMAKPLGWQGIDGCWRTFSVGSPKHTYSWPSSISATPVEFKSFLVMGSTLEVATVGLVEIPDEIPDDCSSLLLHVASVHGLWVNLVTFRKSSRLQTQNIGVLWHSLDPTYPTCGWMTLYIYIYVLLLSLMILIVLMFVVQQSSLFNQRQKVWWLWTGWSQLASEGGVSQFSVGW